MSGEKSALVVGLDPALRPDPEIETGCPPADLAVAVIAGYFTR